MELSRRKIIQRHRKLWRAIAKGENVSNLRAPNNINGCWCCVWARHVFILAPFNLYDTMCDYCPIKWRVEKCHLDGSEWTDFANNRTPENALIVANLPSRRVSKVECQLKKEGKL